MDPIFTMGDANDIPIDSENIFDPSCLREVSIVPSENDKPIKMSSDKTAFNISVAYPLISFFAVLVQPTGKLLVVM